MVEKAGKCVPRPAVMAAFCRERHFGGCVGQTTGVKRALGAAILTALLVAGCADAPEPGDLAAFCTLLETGTGLTPTPTAADLERLALVAPPAVRPTITALQDRARDFNELMAEEPPNLEALFNARFDPQASSEQAALDRYALSSCGIAADRPAPTRWNSFTEDNYGDAGWRALVTAQFTVASERISTATLVFAQAPEPITLLEDACRAVSEFLVADGADPGGVQVVVGSVVALEFDSPGGSCQLP